MEKGRFRAIIPEHNAILYFDFDDLVGKYRDLFSKRLLLTPWLLAGNEPNEYIGQDDKDGVEIYSGDIVVLELPVQDDYPDGVSAGHVVTWETPSFCFRCPDKRHQLVGGIYSNRWKVVGNIVETPHLLNIKKSDE